VIPEDDLQKKLSDYFQIDADCLDKDIFCLMDIRKENENVTILCRAINGLRRIGCYNIGDLLGLTHHQVNCTRGMGTKTRYLLYTLLTRIEYKPELIRYCHEPPMSIAIQERTPKSSERMEEIKDRLREMGMIT